MWQIVLRYWIAKPTARTGSTINPRTGRPIVYNKPYYKDWLSSTRAMLSSALALQIRSGYTMPPTHKRLWIVVYISSTGLLPGDWDNYVKALADASQGFLWRNDRSIREGHVYLHERRKMNYILVRWGIIDETEADLHKPTEQEIS